MGEAVRSRMWQHVEMHRRRSSADLTHRPPSFLVARSLSRARHVLLEQLRIRWVRAAIADVANHITG